MFKRLISVFSAAVLAALLCGCAYTPKNEEKVRVVATIFPIYDFARAVGGDRIDLKLLIRPGTEVHSYDPRPSDIAAVENSDLFAFIGGESDEWARRLINGSKRKLNVLELMKHAKLLTEDGEDEYDEHIWTSPANAVSMVDAVCGALCEIDKENADYYRKNAAEYTDKIRAVREELSAAAESMPKKYILVADRFPFKYFASEFGLSYSAAFGGCASDTDISLKTMTRLVNDVKTHGCTAAYYTELSNRQIADALAEETGVTLLQLHSAHNVTLDDFNNGITYNDIMRRKDEVLKGQKNDADRG